MADEQATPTAAQPLRRRVGFWRWIWRISAGSFAVLVVLLALFIGLFRVAVPLLPDFQQRIETAATDALGFPVAVGSVDARWRLQGPELVFDNVVVRTTDSQSVLLQASRLRVVIDVMALIRGGSIRPSSITLTGTELAVRRNADGIWFVQNIPLDSLHSDRPLTAAWGVANGEFGLHNLSLSVKDEVRDTSYSIPDIDVDVSVHDNLIGVSGELEFVRRGPRLEFSVDANGRVDQLERVDWAGYVAGSRINWPAIEAMLPEQPAWSTSKPLDLSIWLRATGITPREANITVDARDIEVASIEHSVARVAGQFSWTGEPANWQLVGEAVDISSADESTTGMVRFGVLTSAVAGADAMNASSEKQPGSRQFTFAATELNLEQLVILATPLDERVAQWADELVPTGQISDLEGFVEIDAEKLVDFGLTATLNSIGINGAEGRPGFAGVDARIFGGWESGGVELRRAAQLALPGILRDAISIDTALANVVWEQKNNALHIGVTDIVLETADMEVAGQVAFERASPEASLNGDFNLSVGWLDLAQAYRYFPANRFSEQLLKWLDAALTAGSGTNGHFRLVGPLNKFPYPNPEDGEFTASLRLNDATLNYANSWPVMTGINADLVFERTGLRAQVEEARILTLPVQNAQATLADFKESVVRVEGAVTADLDDMRAFLDATPLVKNWGSGWRDSQFYGNGSAQISLTIPTRQRDATSFDAALQFEDTRFQFRDWRQTMTDLNGELRASRAGLSASGIRGLFLEEPVEIEVTPSSVSGYTSDVVLKGSARPSSLARNINEGLADHLSGAAEWTASLALPKAEANTPVQLRVRSPLQGMAITLPVPLAKTSAETRFADALLTVVDDGLLALSADYGDGTNIVARIARGDDGFWSVPRAELRFGGGSGSLPDSDRVRVMGSVSELDMSAIVEFAQRNSSDRPWIEIDSAELAVSELSGLKQRFGATTLDMVRDSNGYVLNFLGDRLSGELAVPAAITTESPIVGQFETLRWASTNDDSPIDPKAIPSLRAVVDNFRYNDYELGTLVAHLEARANLVAIREFTTTAPDFTTRTTGSWVFGEGSPTTYLVCDLKSSNVQNTLKALGLAEFMDAAEATARLELSWPEGWTPDYLRTVEGEISVQVGQGKLRSVDPGAGRVFGLLSIGALPRRLNLDFRDVFDSGFGFDSITGDFTVADGNAVTDNLALSGPAANVVIVGRTGLIEKDYDQTAVVYANFGSSLPLAGALAGGPAVGAALLVVTEIFRKPLQNMGKVSYSITGGWDDPQVAKTGSVPPADPAASEEGAEEAAGVPPGTASSEPPNAESGAEQPPAVEIVSSPQSPVPAPR